MKDGSFNILELHIWYPCGTKSEKANSSSAAANFTQTILLRFYQSIQQILDIF